MLLTGAQLCLHWAYSTMSFEINGITISDVKKKEKQAPDVQKLDSANHRINYCPVDKY